MVTGIGLVGCNEPVDGPQHAEAVGVEEARVDEVPQELVTVAGTVRVFGQEDVTLANITVCEETTATCTTTDGAGGFSLYAPQDTDLVLSATGNDLFVSLLPMQADPDLSIDLRVMPTRAAEAFVELADGQLRADNGMAIVLITDGEGEPLEDMWMTIRDFAAWGPIFTEDGIKPVPGRELSSETGVGAYLELPEGLEEIGVGGDGRRCSSPYLGQTDEDLFKVGVRGGAITWLHVTCE